MNGDLIPQLTEFETKYDIEPHTLPLFRKIAASQSNLKRYLHISGPDIYYTNDHILNRFNKFAEENLKDESLEVFTSLMNETIKQFPPFMRFRMPSDGPEAARKEITTKYKKGGSKNNIQREEKNIRVDYTEEETVARFITDMGYRHNFSIEKICHIYDMDDATLVFYTVYDITSEKTTRMKTFIEIEVDEELIPSLTEDQAWAIIEKYEKILEPVGVSARSRLRKSLFETFKKEVK